MGSILVLGAKGAGGDEDKAREVSACTRLSDETSVVLFPTIFAAHLAVPNSKVVDVICLTASLEALLCLSSLCHCYANQKLASISGIDCHLSFFLVGACVHVCVSVCTQCGWWVLAQGRKQGASLPSL